MKTPLPQIKKRNRLYMNWLTNLLENKYENFNPRSTAKTSTPNILTVSKAYFSLKFGSNYSFSPSTFGYA